MTWVGLIGRGCLLIKRSISYKFHNMCPLRRQNWGLQYIWPFCDWGTNCRQPFSMVQSSSGIQIPIALGGSVYRKVESRCGLTTGAKVNKTSYSVKIWLQFKRQNSYIPQERLDSSNFLPYPLELLWSSFGDLLYKIQFLFHSHFLDFILKTTSYLLYLISYLHHQFLVADELKK